MQRALSIGPLPIERASSIYAQPPFLERSATQFAHFSHGHRPSAPSVPSSPTPARPAYARVQSSPQGHAAMYPAVGGGPVSSPSPAPGNAAAYAYQPSAASPIASPSAASSPAAPLLRPAAVAAPALSRAERKALEEAERERRKEAERKEKLVDLEGLLAASMQLVQEVQDWREQCKDDEEEEKPRDPSLVSLFFPASQQVGPREEFMRQVKDMERRRLKLTAELRLTKKKAAQQGAGERVVSDASVETYEALLSGVMERVDDYRALQPFLLLLLQHSAMLSQMKEWEEPNDADVRAIVDRVSSPRSVHALLLLLLLYAKDVSVSEQVVRLLFAYMHVDHRVVDAFMHADVLPCLMTTVRYHRRCPEVLDPVLRLLLFLSSSIRHQRSMMGHAVDEWCIGLLNDERVTATDPQGSLSSLAFSLLSAFVSVSEENRDRLVQAGALTAIVLRMARQPGNGQLVMDGLYCLDTLTVSFTLFQAELSVDSTFHTLLAMCSAHPQSVSVQRQCVSILLKLCEASDANKERVCQSPVDGDVATLLACLNAHGVQEDLAMTCCILLSTLLAYRQTHSLVVGHVRPDDVSHGISTIIPILHTHLYSPQLQVHAASALYYLLASLPMYRIALDGPTQLKLVDVLTRGLHMYADDVLYVRHCSACLLQLIVYYPAVGEKVRVMGIEQELMDVQTKMRRTAAGGRLPDDSEECLTVLNTLLNVLKTNQQAMAAPQEAVQPSAAASRNRNVRRLSAQKAVQPIEGLVAPPEPLTERAPPRPAVPPPPKKEEVDLVALYWNQAAEPAPAVAAPAPVKPLPLTVAAEQQVILVPPAPLEPPLEDAGPHRPSARSPSSTLVSAYSSFLSPDFKPIVFLSQPESPRPSSSLPASFPDPIPAVAAAAPAASVPPHPTVESSLPPPAVMESKVHEPVVVVIEEPPSKTVVKRKKRTGDATPPTDTRALAEMRQSIAAAVRSLKNSTPVPWQLQSLHALVCLTSASSASSAPPSSALVDALMKEKASSVVVRSMRRLESNEEIQRLGCALLTFIASSPLHRQRLSEEGAVEGAVNALQMGRDTAEQGLACLASLVSDRVVAAQVQRTSVVHIVFIVMKRWSKDVRVLRWAVDCVRRIGDVNKAEVGSWEGLAVGAMVSSLAVGLAGAEEEDEGRVAMVVGVLEVLGWLWLGKRSAEVSVGDLELVCEAAEHGAENVRHAAAALLKALWEAARTRRQLRERMEAVRVMQRVQAAERRAQPLQAISAAPSPPGDVQPAVLEVVEQPAVLEVSATQVAIPEEVDATTAEDEEDEERQVQDDAECADEQPLITTRGSSQLSVEEAEEHVPKAAVAAEESAEPLSVDDDLTPTMESLAAMNELREQEEEQEEEEEEVDEEDDEVEQDSLTLPTGRERAEGEAEVVGSAKGACDVVELERKEVEESHVHDDAQRQDAPAAQLHRVEDGSPSQITSTVRSVPPLARSEKGRTSRSARSRPQRSAVLTL